MDFTLTKAQQRIFDLIESSDKNILVHGKPGVGKSVLIRALRETGSKYYVLGAPTGLAALNIGGKTLHSIFGIPVSEGIFAPDFNNFTNNDNVRKFLEHKVQHLIIDEISMVRADLLDYIDRLMQYIKGNDLPFGGIQVIAVGDFFQLPPIVQSKEKAQLRDYNYKSEFAFDAHVFEGNFETVVLDEVLRQSDPDFIDILHAARSGKVSEKHLKKLNKRVEACTDFRIKLTATNKEADTINISSLSSLPDKPQTYVADKYGHWYATNTDPQITLKVGAQVMIKKNNADRKQGKGAEPASGKIVNGTLAKIVELPTGNADPIKVQLEDGSVLNVWRARWERKEKEKVDNTWEEKVVATFEQYPVQLAWAISMHKSQGQSFTHLHVDASRIFAAGQLYVALSRARSIEGLSLARPLKSSMFLVNQRVINFEKQLTK